ncbi:MAG: TIGR01212 family radical SAM protein [Candidatus Omnitrophota bacterium]
MENVPYYSFNNYLRQKFSARVHRISLNAGFSCPHRDGSKGTKGCFFCNEAGFANFKDTKVNLKTQILTSMEYYRKRFKAEKFFAYFQNASNTHADVLQLKNVYDVIREFSEIIGLSISTRPDCIDAEKLDLIESYTDKYEVWIEYGVQTIHEKSLKLINRQHTFSQSQSAIEQTAKRNIKIAVHVILGLPGETKADMMQSAKKLSQMPINGIKFHIFHILKNTQFEEIYKKEKFKLLSKTEYVDLVCDFLENLNKEYVIMRLVSNTRENVLIGPTWINDKQKVIKDIENELKARNSYQGKLLSEQIQVG